MQILMRACILFLELIVVLVGAVGVISFSEKHCLSMTEVEVECLRVSFGLVESDVFDLGGGFVAVVVGMEAKLG